MNENGNGMNLRLRTLEGTKEELDGVSLADLVGLAAHLICEEEADGISLTCAGTQETQLSPEEAAKARFVVLPMVKVEYLYHVAHARGLKEALRFAGSFEN